MIKILIIFVLVSACAGCDRLYRLLQKEGAEEKDLVGNIILLQSNQKVREIQKLLKLYGYKVGKPDGLLGANTRNAIAQFQKDHGLEVTRFVDQPTWEKMDIFSHYGLTYEGDLNIEGVQMALEEAGIDAGGVDGKMGRRTQEGIKEFQKLKGLNVDGKVGYQTLTELSQYLLYQE